MSFPASQLPAVTELLIDGVWTTATVREESGVQITRGRANESGRVAASVCDLTLDNRSGNYSNRNPNSVNFGLLGRNTQLRHRLRWVYDTFTRTASGLGVEESPAAYAWTTTGGIAGDYATASGFAGIVFTAAGQIKRAQVGPLMADGRIACQVRPEVNAAGGPIDLGVMARRDSVSDIAYEFMVRFEVGGTTRLRVNQVVAGVATNVYDAALADTYNGASTFDIVADVKNDRIRAQAWNHANADPVTWQADFTNGNIPRTSPGQAGIVGRVQAGNSNGTFTPHWDNLDASDYRFWGEAPSWPQTWEISGADVTAPIEAAGIMRRLGGSAKPLRSALTRAMLGVADGDFEPIAHWSMEDGSGAASFASSFTGQPPATVTGSVSPAAYGGFIGSDPLPILTNAVITAPLPAYTDTGAWQLQFTLMVPSTGFTNNADMVIIKMAPGKPTATIYLTYILATDELRLTAMDATGNVLAAGGTTFGGFSQQRDTPYLCAITDLVSAGTHIILFSIFPPTNGTALLQVNIQPDGIGAGTAGVPTQWQALASSVSTGWSFGQPALYVDPSFVGTPNIGPNARAAGGYVGETATDRMIRLCREERIYLEVIGDTADSAALGPQTSGKLLDLLFGCADADFGILFEPRDALGLAYRTRPTLYNQTGLTLDYAARQVFPPFAPTEDDQLVVNDATARRPNGSFARVVAEPGRLSTSDPPDGVGTYDEDRTYDVYADGQLAPIAGWRVHVGTWDDARYPQVHVMLHAPGLSSPALSAQAAAVDVADYLSVTNPPPWLPPDSIELLAQGYRETLHTYEWDITWNTTPAGPYKVFELDSATFGRLDGDHALNSSVTTSGTSWSVKTLSGPVLTDVDAEDGMQWMVEGELVTVTDISGTSSPQTCTVTRSVNGIVKAHPGDVPVALFPAPFLGL